MLIFPHYQTMFLSLHVITDRCRLRGVEGRKGVVLLLDEKGIDGLGPFLISTISAVGGRGMGKGWDKNVRPLGT